MTTTGKRLALLGVCIAAVAFVWTLWGGPPRGSVAGLTSGSTSLGSSGGALPAESRSLRSGPAGLEPAATRVGGVEADASVRATGAPTARAGSQREVAYPAPSTHHAAASVPLLAPLPTRAAAPSDSRPASSEAPRTYQEARDLLTRVGTDVVADAAWIAAINDPKFSAEQRSDLIEDLNEVGFIKPGAATKEEMEMVASRIQLIEEQAPYAMDESNAAAFKEALKDLMNLAAKLTKR